MIETLSLFWLLPAAVQDWRTRQVSNWLTLPALGLALIVRLIGWPQKDLGSVTTTPWWLIALVTSLALGLWYFDQLGGADAKGWIAFALLGERILLAAALGLLIWYPLARRTGVVAEGRRTPGYPGYLLGIFLLVFWTLYLAYA